MITHLEPDILECKVKWPLGSITMNKARGGNGIPADLVHILKDDAIKVLCSVGQENSAVATGLENVSSHSNPKERQCQRMFKLPHNCTHLTRWQSNAQNSPSQASTTRTENFQMYKLVLEKAEEPEIKLPTSTGSSKKQESSRKTSTYTVKKQHLLLFIRKKLQLTTTAQ